MDARMTIIATIIAALALSGCGSKKGDEDGTTDVPEDPATDLVADAEPDMEPDALPDAEPDVGPDVEPDTALDVEPDEPEDPPEEWPTDVPADWPVDTPSGCASAGGFCTAVRWEICPVGYEPVDPDPHRDCGGSTGIAGWCCVVAPYSTCSAYAGGNCVVGTSCTGCWGPVTGYTCESGRVCCEDICD